MGLGFPKDLIIVFIISFFYGYGTHSFFRGLELFAIYILIRAIYKLLTDKSNGK